MRSMHKGLLVAGVAVVCLVLANVRAADEKKTKRPEGANRQPGARQPGARQPGNRPFQFGQTGPLVSTELAEKLKLSGEQKDKIAKLQKDFEEKTKEPSDKLKELREKRDREAFQAMREQMTAIRKTRGEFTDKVKELLKDDQKKTFEEEIAKQTVPGGRPGQPGQFGRGQPGNIFAPDVQEKLGLNAEQKEKLEKLKKDLDAKSLEVLTAEQKKKLEELKAARPQVPNRRPPQQ